MTNDECAQLQYCASIQFFERCQASNNSHENRENAYFRTRVSQALGRCLNPKAGAAPSDASCCSRVSTDLESSLEAVNWRELFSAHVNDSQCDQPSHGAGTAKSALREVCNAICSVLSKHTSRDRTAILFLKTWAYNRELSKEFKWESADQYMLYFVGQQLVKEKSLSQKCYGHPGNGMLWRGIITQCNAEICQEIESVFALGEPTEFSDDSKESNVATRRKRLTSKARSWVHLLKDIHNETLQLSDAVSNSLLAVLRTLDDVDINNLHIRVNYETSKQTFSRSSTTNPKKRRRLPPGTRSSDIVQAMHDSMLNETDGVQALNLGQVDRHYRAKRSHYECSAMKVSLKQLLNAPLKPISQRVTVDAAESSEDVRIASTITTLPIEAVVLRRDLYQYLVKLHTLDFKETMKNVGSNARQNTAIWDSMLLQLTSTLLLRLEQNHISPSIRLYIVMTLDYLRELSLSDRGYQCMLDEITARLKNQDCPEEGGDFFLKFYVEMVAECEVFASPRRLVSALTKLMELCLTGNGGPVLQAVGRIMLRRKNILLRLNERDTSRHLPFDDDLTRFDDLVRTMSMKYDSLSFWIRPDISRDDIFELLAILQSLGILSLFDSEDIGCSIASKATKFPDSSLRCAHLRMGSCPGFNNVLTHPLAYRKWYPLNDTTILLDSSDEIAPSPLSSVDSDILSSIFDFLGYRSLTRASQCCLEWQHASRSQSRWLRLYFQRFKCSVLTEECSSLTSMKSCIDRHKFTSRELDKRIAFAGKLDGYHNWQYLFKEKYKSVNAAKAYSVGKANKYNVCPFVGCHALVCNDRQTFGHLKTHVRHAGILTKRRKELEMLNTTVSQLHQDLAVLRISTQSGDPTPEHLTEAREITSPESLLQLLVFPFLDVTDLLKPVCTVWAELSQCNLLWERLYYQRFGVPCTKWLPGNPSLKPWNELFRDMYRTRRLVNDDIDRFGWKYRVCSTLGCCRILGNKLDADIHALKHEVKYCKERLKANRRRRQN